MGTPQQTDVPPAAPGARQVRTIAIVGAGFSGAVTAVQLLRLARAPLRVVLVNESGRMARGLAYGTHSSAHVLNVPAGNMSALADDADDFLRYCRWSDPQVQPQAFVPRRLYGAYLEALLSTAELAGDDDIGLERVTGRVCAVHLGADRAQLRLQDGSLLLADEVVLAFGHFRPRDPLPQQALDAAAGRYVSDPWKPGALEAIGPGDDVLLVGAGLTAVDVSLALHRRPRSGRLLLISRRGLPSQSHRPSGASPGVIDGAALASAMGGSLRGAMRALRLALRQCAARGEDWRDVIGALRPHTPALWQRLSPADKARFLRHVQPHWDMARHRCAPQAHDAFEALRVAGRLQSLAARVVDVRVVDAGLDVTLQPRGGGPLQRRVVQAIVNCTGPTSDLRRSGSPLIAQLLEAGQLCPDALGLGLHVDPGYRVLGHGGQAVERLRYIGPLLKAGAWEATAVPELRQHALRLARLLLA